MSEEEIPRAVINSRVEEITMLLCIRRVVGERARSGGAINLDNTEVDTLFT